MIADLLNRRSLGSLNSLAEDSLSTFNDAFTIYGHPKVKDVLKAFEQMQVVQLPDYRTAIKLRTIQRKMELHRVDVRDIVTVFSESGLAAFHQEIGEAEMEPIINDVCLMAEKSADTTAVSNADLILTWVLQLFDSNYVGAVRVRQFTTALVVIGAGRLHDKLKYIFDVHKTPSDGLLSQQGFSELLADLLLIPCSVFEEEVYGHSSLVMNALFDCFSQMGQEIERISLEEFLVWCIRAPFSISWIFTLHRLMSSEYAVNTVPCSMCSASPYLGFRYVSLHSYNLGLCQDCAWTGNTNGESEFREFGALSQCVNVAVVPRSSPSTASTQNVSDINVLTAVHQNLDQRHENLLNYCKRIDPKSPSHFITLSESITTEDDNVEAFLGECEDRATKLQRDFISLSKEHSEVLLSERKRDNLAVWKQRDDLSCRLAVWMSRRNDLYVKSEDLLREHNVAIPNLNYNSQSALGSHKSLDNHSAKFTGSLDGLEKLNTKVSVEDSVMVLSKLSLIVNNALLQKSISSTPSKQRPLKQISTERPLPESPMSFENKAAAFSISNGVSKENIPSIRENVASSKEDLSTLTGTEKDVMLEFENAMIDIMIQEPVPEVNASTPKLMDRPSSSNGVSTTSGHVKTVEPPPRSANTSHSSTAHDQEDLWETESDGSWETEEENTANTERTHDPPDSLALPTEEAGVISEPECDPPEGETIPVPPPRTLLSPQGVARRATSLKTKDPADPRMEELRKVTRAASSVHTKHKPGLTGIPTRTPPLLSPVGTPPLRGSRAGSRTPISERGGTPTSAATPDTLREVPAVGSNSDLRPGSARSDRGAAPTSRPGSSKSRGPIVYEGDTDSETSTSSSSDSSDEEKKKKKFSRARSARFARSKIAPPNRNAASFRNKKPAKPEKPLEFFNSFAE